MYVPDAKLWSIYRDIHDSITVRVLVSRGENVPDSMRTATDEEIRRYYEAHKNEFRRPSRALMSYVSISKLPTPVDSVALVARVRSLRDSIVRGNADFADVARTESSDTASGNQGGSLGTVSRGQMVPGNFSMDPRKVTLKDGLLTLTRLSFTLPNGTKDTSAAAVA